MKIIQLINSVLWVAAAVYFFYAVVRGLLTLDWRLAVIGLLIVAFFTITQIVIAFVVS